MSVDIETEISYASFGNYRKRLANNRFRQELVISVHEKVEEGVRRFGKNLELIEKRNVTVIGTIVHDNDLTFDSFHAQYESLVKDHSFLAREHVLDGVSYECTIWKHTKSYKDDDILQKLLDVIGKRDYQLSAETFSPGFCWVCGRIFMSRARLVYSQDKWYHLDYRPIWCSPECQVKVASHRLAQQRKAQRHSIDKTTSCKQCGLPFIPKRLGSSFCSSNCRLRHHRHTHSRMTNAD